MPDAANSPTLGPIGQIAVNAKDLPRAVRFYRDALGMRFLFEAPKMAFFDAAGVRLMLAVADEPELAHPSSILYFRVSDIDAAHTALTARGVEFVRAPQLTAKMPDHELWMAFFHDSEANLLALMAEQPI